MSGIVAMGVDHPVSTSAIVAIAVVSVLLIVCEVVRGWMRERRERQALQLAVAVYQVGGDPAEVLRAMKPSRTAAAQKTTLAADSPRPSGTYR